MLLVLGTSVLLREMSLSFNAVFHACNVAIPGAFFAGLCGYAMGRVIETADYGYKKSASAQSDKKQDSDILIDDLLVDDMENLDKTPETSK